jgi:PncC family amidohydrolase
MRVATDHWIDDHNPSYNGSIMNKPIEAQIGEMLLARGWRLAAAESCTGGLISHRVTNISGSSVYFLGGVTAYANEVKMGMLGVAEQTLIENGAVSSETVAEMAAGVRSRLGADVGVSVSGIAGPGGGTPEKPVGLVWIGVAGPDGVWTRRFKFQGGREQIKDQSAEAALQLVGEYLAGEIHGAR